MKKRLIKNNIKLDKQIEIDNNRDTLDRRKEMQPVIKHSSLAIFEAIIWLGKNIFRFIKRRKNETRSDV